MTKVNVSLLTDSARDWAVEQIEKPHNPDAQETILKFGKSSFSPSTNWAQGEPIIERKRIQIRPMRGNEWDAYYGQFGCTGTAPTPLIVAMRCYVSSKLGNIIEIPDNLV
jgi:hypothetical protein